MPFYYADSVEISHPVSCGSTEATDAPESDCVRELLHPIALRLELDASVYRRLNVRPLDFLLRKFTVPQVSLWNSI